MEVDQRPIVVAIAGPNGLDRGNVATKKDEIANPFGNLDDGVTLPAAPGSGVSDGPHCHLTRSQGLSRKHSHPPPLLSSRSKRGAVISAAGVPGSGRSPPRG